MVNVFSFCLYGPENPRYYPGMIENVILAQTYFPSWKVLVYYAPDVTQDMVGRLQSYSNVVLRPTGQVGPINMIHRFYAIDEPTVELMMVRDADSRIHWKDRWAIQQFLKDSSVLHIIRDHKEHTSPVLGGLWGLRKVAGFSIRQAYESYTEDKELGHRWAHDQNFLADVIYPKFLSQSMVHFSHRRIFKGENYVFPFPFEWSNDIYCGRIEEPVFREKSIPRNPPLSFLPNVLVKLSR